MIVPSRNAMAWAVMVLAATAAIASAEEGGDTQPPSPAPTVTQQSSSSVWRALGACFAAAGAAAGGGLAIAKIGSKCLDSMARQPEAAGQMFGPMLIAAAMVEGAMLFAILVCLLTVFTG